MTAKGNHKLFREMSEPFASDEEAGKAVDAFSAEFAELRKKHRIKNVYCVMNVPYISEGGEADSGDEVMDDICRMDVVELLVWRDAAMRTCEHLGMLPSEFGAYIRLCRATSHVPQVGKQPRPDLLAEDSTV